MKQTQGLPLKEEAEKVVALVSCTLSGAGGSAGADVILKNNSQRTVTGVSLSFSGKDNTGAPSLIPTCTVLCPAVAPGETFAMRVPVPERWKHIKAEIRSFRSGDLVYTLSDDGSKICRRLGESELTFEERIRPVKKDGGRELTVGWRKRAVWLTLAGALLLTALCVLTAFFYLPPQ